MSTQHPRLLCLDVHAFVCNENTFVCTVHTRMGMLLTRIFHATSFASPSVWHPALFKLQLPHVVNYAELSAICLYGVTKPSACSHILPSSVICSGNLLPGSWDFCSPWLELVSCQLQPLPTQAPSLELAGGYRRPAAKGPVVSVHLCGHKLCLGT